MSLLPGWWKRRKENQSRGFVVESLQTGIPGPPALPPSLHSPAFVTVESVEEVRPSFCHRGAGELREAGRQELELREHLGSP